MRVLHLFAGAGGGVLADRLLGNTSVGYVEWGPYCQAVLQARIADGMLDSAPIFGDVRQFVSSGLAREYRGVADVVAGGFPCQPFSVAGKRAGSADDRNMWPAFREVVEQVRPRYVFAENVPGLLTWDGGAYFGRVVSDLAALGFAVRWTVLGADDVGAPHRRKRLWILADAMRDGWRAVCTAHGDPDQIAEVANDLPGWEDWHLAATGARSSIGGAADSGEHSGLWGSRAADVSDSQRNPIRDEPGRCGGPGGAGTGEPRHDGSAGAVADTIGSLCGRGADEPGREAQGRAPAGGDGCGWWSLDPADLPDADSTGRGEQRRTQPVGEEHASTGCGSGWPVESRVGRVAHGVAHRVDRLRAIGNGQVPAVAVLAWRLLGGPIA